MKLVTPVDVLAAQQATLTGSGIVSATAVGSLAASEATLAGSGDVSQIPRWTVLGNITATEGIASSHDLRPDINNYLAGDVISFPFGLPFGWSLNADGFTLDYDGTGPVSAVVTTFQVQRTGFPADQVDRTIAVIAGPVFGEPPRLAEFRTRLVDEIEGNDSFNRGHPWINAGPSNISAADYGENGPRTVFYSGWMGTRNAIEYCNRVGIPLNWSLEAWRRQLQTDRGRWNTGVGVANARNRAADLWYYAYLDGFQYYDSRTTLLQTDLITAGLQEIEDAITSFTRNNLSNCGLGPFSDTGGDHGRMSATYNSRPTAYLQKALTYYEQANGFPYVEPAAGQDFLPWIYAASVSNLYRFWTEQFNSFTDSTVTTRVDTGANFMVSLNVHACLDTRDMLLASSRDPDLWFPGTGSQARTPNVLDGQQFESETSWSVYSEIPCPWTTTGVTSEANLNMLYDIAEWWVGAMDLPGWAPDVLPLDGNLDQRAPITTRAEYNANGGNLNPRPAYFRVQYEHLARNEVVGGVQDKLRRVGDPMLRMNSAGVFNVLGRSGAAPNSGVVTENGGQNANGNQGLQMLIASAVARIAGALFDSGAAQADYERVLRWADLLFEGTVEHGAHRTCRSLNQHLVYMQHYFDSRNRILGRND